jgi:hypothetical protein
MMVVVMCAVFAPPKISLLCNPFVVMMHHGSTKDRPARESHKRPT